MIEFRHKSTDGTPFRWLNATSYNLYDGRMTVEQTHFMHYEFRVDGVVFTKWSKEFEEALSKECLWRRLRGTNDR